MRALTTKTAGDRPSAAGYGVLFRTRPLVIFALCAFFFHFANAPLLPLVGQKLALQFPQEATAMMSFCIVAAQGVMLPIAILVGRKADLGDGGQFFSLRSRLCRSVQHSTHCRITPSGRLQFNCSTGSGRASIKRLRRWSSRISCTAPAVQSAQGAVATTRGSARRSAPLAAGVVVDHFGYSVCFLALGAAAALSLSRLFRLHAGDAQRGLHRPRS